MKMKVKVVLALVIVAVLALSIKGAYASSPPSGTWMIQYFTVSGGSCTNIPYTPTAKDGGGFAVNQPPNNNQDPIVRATQSVCIEISVTGGAHNSKVWWELGSILGPMNIGTTDSNGNMDVKFVITIPTLSGSNCFTTPQKVIYFNNGTPGNSDFNGNIIDHIWTGSSDCSMPPTQGVPEFPLGIVTLIGLSAVLVVLIRRDFLGKYVHL